jgi:N-acetylmuramoyl-L-alanine amidase
VSRQISRKRILIALVAIVMSMLALAFYGPTPVAAPPAPPTKLALAAARTSETPSPAESRRMEGPTAGSSATAARSPTPAPALPSAIPAAIPPTPTSSVLPTPTPRPAGTIPRVGIQVGHWKSQELPDELARLRTSSGAFAGGYHEADVNLAIAKRVAALLESRGLAVDLLPATIPPGYDADAFVAIHADGSSSGNSRGFKLATPWRTSRASQMLLDLLTIEYASATGLPQDYAVTFNMRGYYAFNNRRREHAIARTTPAVIIEMGFLTSATDRAVIIGQPDNVAIGITNGIIRYLNERDPNDGAALLPPDFKVQRPISPDGLDVRSAPRDNAQVLSHVDADGRLFVFQERDGWYQGFVRGGSRILGWFRKDQVTETNDPPPTPPPSTDS